MLFDKRETFPFPIPRMPHIDSSIPQNIFYSAMKGELCRIARLILYLNDFTSNVKKLLRHKRRII